MIRHFFKYDSCPKTCVLPNSLFVKAAHKSTDFYGYIFKNTFHWCIYSLAKYVYRFTLNELALIQIMA